MYAQFIKSGMVPTVEVGGRYLVNPSTRQVLAAAGIERKRHRLR